MEAKDNFNRAVTLYNKKDRTEEDLMEAVGLFISSADAGYASSMNWLGFLYKNGIGVEQDVTKAKTLYQNAAEHGETDAMEKLGMLLYDEKNYVGARKWFSRAASLASPVAENWYAHMLEYGIGGDTDISEAFIWYEQAVRDGGEKTNAAENLERLQRKESGLRSMAWEHVFLVTFLEHSGFVLETGACTYLFDYWIGELPDFSKDKPLYIFVSHEHRDHFNTDVFKFDSFRNDVCYVLPEGVMNVLGRKADELKCVQAVSANKTYSDIGPAGLTVRTLESNDLGVAFLIRERNRLFYHAGDLNLWARKEEYDIYGEYYITTLKNDYGNRIDALIGRSIDIAFAAMDPRLGIFQFAGIEALAATAKCVYIFPMHMWRDFSGCTEFLRKYPEMSGTFIPTEVQGEKFLLKERAVNHSAYEEFRKNNSTENEMIDILIAPTGSSFRFKSAAKKTDNKSKEKPVYVIQRESWIRLGRCQNCGGEFKKGLFGSKCKKCGKPKDY